MISILDLPFFVVDFLAAGVRDFFGIFWVAKKEPETPVLELLPPPPAPYVLEQFVPVLEPESNEPSEVLLRDLLKVSL